MRCNWRLGAAKPSSIVIAEFWSSIVSLESKQKSDLIFRVDIDSRRSITITKLPVGLTFEHLVPVMQA